jgi:large subunit ribosomal protein L27e
LVLKGRYSGSKAIILGENSPNKGKSYNSYLVGGIKKCPKKNSRYSKDNKNERKIRMKIFVKKININHIMPTRFYIDLNKNSKKIVDEKIKDFQDITQKEYENVPKIGKEKKIFGSFVKNIFLDQFFSGKHKWFFKKLNF